MAASDRGRGDRRAAARARRRRARLAGAVLVAVTLAVAGSLAAGWGGGPPPAPGREEPARNPGCSRSTPPAAEPRTYGRAPNPARILSPGTDYGAVIETSCGTIEVDLLEDRAPRAVANFVFLAEEGFYEGLTFHRVVRNFIVQAGDPEGTGRGGPGYTFPDELWARSRDYTFGAMAMANSGPDTNGSQFFFVTHDFDAVRAGEPPEPAGVQALYTLFGRTDPDSYATLDRIQKVPTSTELPRPDRPLVPVFIESVRITRS